MNYTKITISVENTELIERLCDQLCADDITEFEIIAPNIGAPLNDGELPPDAISPAKEAPTAVNIYVEQNSEGEEKIAQIQQLDFGFDVKFMIEEVCEEDWANNWKEFFKPIFVGEKIIICPEWETAPEDTNRTVFYINPGMSFGTGSHETTRLCIAQLERYVTDDTSVLDLGCGSGILSVIACLLGASCATAVDIDADSVKTAKENAEKNNVPSEKYQAFVGNVSDDDFTLNGAKYDVVVANIVADIIIKICKKTRDLVVENGVFIAGGIILDRLDEVKSAVIASGFEIKDIEIDGEWAVIVCINSM